MFVGHLLHNCSESSGGALNPSKLYVVCVSLGCQISGGIGKAMFEQSGTKITRMTALDPAGPNFEGNVSNAKNCLRKDDIGSIDCIHGDAGYYGMSHSVCTVDFWPNNGVRSQPGCPSTDAPVSEDAVNPCSHCRPGEFFLESVRNTRKDSEFYGMKKDDNGTMLADDIVPMRINCPRNASGNYYLITGSKSPYSLGMSGARVQQ